MVDPGPSPSPPPLGTKPRRVPVGPAAAGAGGIGLGIVGAVLVIGLLSRPAPGASPDPSLVALGSSPSPAVVEPGSSPSPGGTLGGATLEPGDDPSKPRAGSAPPQSAAPVTAAPVTAAPATPRPVTPRPATPKPVTPKPVTPKPVTPRPVTPPPDPAPVARNDSWGPSVLDPIYAANCLVDLNTFANDEDSGVKWPDGSEFKTVVPLAQPAHGDIKLQDVGGTYYIRYEPHHDGPFTDSFTYTIKDGAGQTDSATVTVTFGSGTTGCH
jgi:hypothetical protein